MKRETITNGGTKQQSRHFIRTINGERGLVFSIVASATKQSRPVVVGQETIRRLMGYNTREIMHNERARVARVAQSRTKRLRFSLRCRDISCANYGLVSIHCLLLLAAAATLNRRKSRWTNIERIIRASFYVPFYLPPLFTICFVVDSFFAAR